MRIALIMGGVPLAVIGTALMQSGYRVYGLLPLAAGIAALGMALLAPRRRI